MSKLIVVALEKELPRDMIPSEYNVLYTGIGKVNAANKLAQELTRMPHYQQVINYGRAWVNDNSVMGELLEIGWVMERDMDLTSLGFRKYSSIPDYKNFMFPTNNLDTEIVCGTGDNYDTKNFSTETQPYHIIDTEAFALAKVCLDYQIIFKCYKYISNNMSDRNPDKSWNKNIHQSAVKFLEKIGAK